MRVGITCGGNEHDCGAGDYSGSGGRGVLRAYL